jgi:tetratricopeptide (TPR) repeat protein
MRPPSRLRLRRRLLVFSAPLVIVALIAIVKMISVVVAGNSAVSHFSRGDVAALQDDVSALSVLNVIEPAKAPFAAGALAVREGRLDEADAQFSDALSRTDEAQSCPVRINLALVRERQGDVDAWEGRLEQARERYTSALAIVEDAPESCFQGNTDPDAERRAIRNDAAARLTAKMAGLRAAPPPPPPPPQAAPPPPPPPPPAPAAPEPDAPQAPLRLEPGAGDPIEKLRQLLEDAAG